MLNFIPINPAVDYDTEEVVSDLLYTLFQTMDEYITYLIEHGNPGEDLRRMQNYIEMAMRSYAKDLYKVEVDET